MPEGEVPEGRGVGELRSSVTSPPLTAKPLTTSPRPPVTNRDLPSGESRASAAPAPLVRGSGRGGAAHNAECGDHEGAQRREAELFSHFPLQCFAGRIVNGPSDPR